MNMSEANWGPQIVKVLFHPWCKNKKCTSNTKYWLAQWRGGPNLSTSLAPCSWKIIHSYKIRTSEFFGLGSVLSKINCNLIQWKKGKRNVNSLLGWPLLAPRHWARQSRCEVNQPYIPSPISHFLERNRKKCTLSLSRNPWKSKEIYATITFTESLKC